MKSSSSPSTSSSSLHELGSKRNQFLLLQREALKLDILFQLENSNRVDFPRVGMSDIPCHRVGLENRDIYVSSCPKKANRIVPSPSIGGHKCHPEAYAPSPAGFNFKCNPTVVRMPLQHWMRRIKWHREQSFVCCGLHVNAAIRDSCNPFSYVKTKRVVSRSTTTIAMWRYPCCCTSAVSQKYCLTSAAARR